MSIPLKFSEASVLGLHAMIYIAVKNETMTTTAEIAEFLNASGHHLSKILQRLVKAGLIKSIRGPKGGFVLGKDSAEISLREIYELFEGTLDPMNCLLKSPVCGNQCVFGDLLTRMTALAIDYLTDTTLSDAVAKQQKGKIAV